MVVAWLIGTMLTQEMCMNLSNSQRDSGGWVYTQLNEFENKKDIDKIIVISVSDSYDEENTFQIGKMQVYAIKDKPVRPIINKKTFKKIDYILQKENVELLDVQGTETALSAYSSYSSIDIPMINTLHGIAYQCYRFYTLGLPRYFLFWGRSLYDNLSLHGIAEAKLLMSRRAKIEEHTLKNILYVRGRTNWDKCCVRFINPSLKYYHTELIMRSAFYEKRWQLEKCIRNRIFVPQMKIPYKGMFMLLKALSYVKNVIPDIEVHIPGAAVRKGFKRNGYEKYIWKLIKKYELQKNIVFVGNLSADQMASELVKARIFVMPSIIENSPNSLTEAQLVGTPAIAALVGGVSDYVIHEKTGMVYNSMDAVMCAQNIIRLMTDIELSNRISEEARIEALKRHEPSMITRSILECYKDIIRLSKKGKNDEKGNNI